MKERLKKVIIWIRKNLIYEMDQTFSTKFRYFDNLQTHFGQYSITSEVWYTDRDKMG